MVVHGRRVQEHQRRRITLSQRALNMLNAFLTDMLQVVIVLDILGVVAWFVLSARRAPHAADATEQVALTASPKVTLWSKLTGSRRQMQPAAYAQSGGNLDDALGQLRRVLESYRTSLT